MGWGCGPQAFILEGYDSNKIFIGNFDKDCTIICSEMFCDTWQSLLHSRISPSALTYLVVQWVMVSDSKLYFLDKIIKIINMILVIRTHGRNARKRKE